MSIFKESWFRFGVIVLCFFSSSQVQAQFAGSPNGKAGEFIRLSNTLDDPNRGFCIDAQGHMQGVNLKIPLNVHTCKDGFWNYDERFSQDTFNKSGYLFMPAFNACLTAVKEVPGSHVMAVQCDPVNLSLQWQMKEGAISLKSDPTLCLTVDAKPSSVSMGTRNHPVRHLVRPLTLEVCEAQSIYQQWEFVSPSEIPGIRYPDGSINDW